MGMFRRRGNSKGGGSTEIIEDGGSSTSYSVDPELQDKAQEVMKDNLELMKGVVMKVREDPEFAKEMKVLLLIWWMTYF